MRVKLHFFVVRLLSFSFPLCDGFLVFCFLGNLLETTKRFSYNELRSATDNFHSRNKIGRGGFGAVYKVSFLLGYTFF